MSTLSVRIPNSLHDDAREIAKAEDVSLSQLIAASLAEKVSAIHADALSRVDN
jgi:predicted HicB family RNase H-like nuclease